ncbi:MAG: DUF58 domain-containing protein [Bifidobacteriaceae bacterium]|nr:DUF58 domain-containing protein [Bifidobacteriaceae bacterium]
MPQARPGKARLKMTARGTCLGLTGSVFVAVALVFARSDALWAGVTLWAALGFSWVAARLGRPPGVLLRTMTPGPLAPRAPVRVRLALAPGTGFAPPAALVRDRTPWLEAEVKADSEGTALGYTFAAPSRGAYPIGPARIAVPGPLGLVTAAYQTAPAAELLVAPALVEVAVTLPDAGSDLPQARTQAGAERVTEPAAVRDYQVGDPRRLVHWKATARRDRLMVREVTLRGLPQAWVLVDDAASPGPAAEAALSISVSVALRLARTGHTVRLVYLAGRAAPDARFDPAAGASAILEAFARSQLAPGPMGPAQAAGAGPGDRLTGPPLSQRLLNGIGARGAIAPIYGALAQADAETLLELSRLAGLARPGQLWVTGSDGLAAALRQQGWTVVRPD